MMKKICSVVLCTALFASGVLSMKPATQASAATNFTFNGSMSKEVLRNYASRAVRFLYSPILFPDRYNEIGKRYGWLLYLLPI